MGLYLMNSTTLEGRDLPILFGLETRLLALASKKLCKELALILQEARPPERGLSELTSTALSWPA